MNDIKQWIEERRGIHAKATPGEWEEDAVSGLEGCVYLTDGSYECVADAMSTDDAGPIVDAHNMFPRAMDAIERVLELHAKSQWGFCTQCMETGEYGWMLAVQWPCATVQAIEGAINHE